MSTREAIRQLCTPWLGGYTGNITSGTATTAVLDGLAGVSSDNNFFVGWMLVMPDAATAADTVRPVTAWASSTGTATFATRADVNYANETYELYPPGSFTLNEINDAFNRNLARTRKTIDLAYPTVMSKTRYALPTMPWVRGSADVDGVTYRNSQNLIGNSDFRWWINGPASAPALWVLAGASGTIARNTSYNPPGVYGAALTRAGTNVTLTHSAGVLGFNSDGLQGLAVTFSCNVYATVASRARIGINDGATTTYSTTYHNGNSTVQLLSVTKTLSASATLCDFICSVDGGDTTATFAHPVAQEGSSIDTTLSNVGDEYWREYPTGYRPIDNAIYLDHQRSRMAQIVVYSAAPFSSVTTDAGSTDCPDLVAMYGTVMQLAALRKANIDRTRFDALVAEHGAAYALEVRGLRQKPAPLQTRQMVIQGA